MALLFSYTIFSGKINHPDNDNEVDNLAFCATINNISGGF